MNELDKLKIKLIQCQRKFDIVGATKIRAQIAKIEFNQEEENRKAAERIKESGALERLQVLHSESYLLFTIAAAKMDEAMDVLIENGITLGSITDAYKSFEKTADVYFDVLGAAINKSENANLCEDYETLTNRLRIVVEKYFSNPKNKKK